MPVYEYRCLDCDRVFENLSRTLDDGGPAAACPGCAGTKTTKLLSVFASPSGAGAREFACGMGDQCCGGGCADQIREA
ncbi:MAG: FmdB family zinc ribbon protein [Candidatus Dormibacteria bacterium]